MLGTSVSVLLNLRHVEKKQFGLNACTTISSCLTVHGSVNFIIVVFVYSQCVISKLVTCQINYYPILTLASLRFGLLQWTHFVLSYLSLLYMLLIYISLCLTEQC